MHRNTNWFSNVSSFDCYNFSRYLDSFQIILIPELVSQVCLLMNDTLSASQLAHCTTITGRTYDTFDRKINGSFLLTGANTLDVAKIGIDEALLTYNVSLITDAYRRIHLELQVNDTVGADGIRADGSFGRSGAFAERGDMTDSTLNRAYRTTWWYIVQRELWSAS